MAAGALGLGILVVLTVGFTYAQPASTRPPAVPVAVAADGAVHLPLAGLRQDELYHFAAEVDGRPVRFLVLRLADGRVVTTFDACLICGDAGYVQDGRGITCLNCHSVIYPASIGHEGGCNPIPLASRVVGGELRIAAADLAGKKAAAGHHGHHRM